ncbi:MAG: thioredoxin family protein [Acidobacteria bacterium]|nr:thioredoxin family protein [Acidobacteriota bacterium]
MRRTDHSDRAPGLDAAAVPMCLAFALAIVACGPKAPPAAALTPPVVVAPQAPPAAPAPGATRAPPALPLTGRTTRAAVESFDDRWRALRAEDYTPDAAAVATIRDKARDVTAYIVLATWCPDTRRDLPRFFKIADQAGWPASRMVLLAVDRTKKDPEGDTVKWNVTRVPTFIFLRGGKEIGRVTERPTATLEQDIAVIVQKD